ncbi:P-loop NTPase fold protein [Microvirga sp. 2YAF29]|uniref:KAP family P-loop NTPase fold protein n=1 Tax=Microvirga sp. 2YAF29 TaxID=3233031 RepID=UPI003F978871
MNKMHHFSDDTPKQNPWTEDRLGYRPFAQRLAKVIIGHQASNGYVIGLQGAWGSGKSTALNFVQAFIEKHNQELQEPNTALRIIDFRPWIVSGHQDLIGAFFKVLTEGLTGPPGRWAKLKKPFLRFFKNASDPLLTAAATVGVTVDPSGGTASKAAVAIAKKSLSSAIDRWLAEPSLQAAYEQLRTSLAQKDKRFLVIIDDIDRLDQPEIRSIMQMVKTVGRLPNVTYLLAYDRTIVWQALDGISSQERSEPAFAEKIVQHELELPRPSKQALLSILDAELAFMLGLIPNTTRWQYLVQNGIARWIRYPRDVSRLANAVKFSWPALEGEIDPQDLLGMEGLRLFDNQAFEWVRQNRDFLFSEGRFVLAQDKAKNKVGEDLRNSLPPETRDQIVDVLCTLFPTRAEIIRGRDAYGEHENYFEIVNRGGIAHQTGYDAYFSLFPSPDAVPKSVIDTMIARMDDEEFLVSTFLGYIGKGSNHQRPLIGSLLEEIRYRFLGRDAAEPTQEMLDALLRVGEDVLRIDWSGGMLMLSPRANFSFLVQSILEAWGPEKATANLLEAFNRAASVTVCAEIFVDRARELGKLPAEGTTHAVRISEDGFKELGEKLLEMIEGAAGSGALSNAPFYWNIVRAWGHLSGPEKPREWIKAGIASDPACLAKLTKGLLAYSVSETGRHYSMHERPDEALYDLSDLKSASEAHLAAAAYSGSEDELRRVQAVLKGAERFLARPEMKADDDAMFDD